VADLEQSTSWQSGRLTFRERPLAEAIAEVNRYSERQLVLEAPSLADLPVSGVFSTDHPENFIAAVAAFYPVRIEERSPTLTVLQLKQK
jgi:transmembrane sensor